MRSSGRGAADPMNSSKEQHKLLTAVNCFAAAVLLVVFPVLHAAVVAANLVAHLTVLGLQVIVTRLPRILLPRRRRIGREPFVSIHVPAHNEPPDLLIQTL